MKREFNLVQSGQARFAKVNNYTKIWRIKCKLGKRGKRAFQAKRIHTQTRQVLEGASRSQVMHWSPGRWSPRLASLTCDLCDNTGPISQKGPMLNTILCCCHPEIPKDFILELVFGQWSMSGSNEDRQGARHTYTSLEAIWGARGPQAGCGVAGPKLTTVPEPTHSASLPAHPQSWSRKRLHEQQLSSPHCNRNPSSKLHQ